MDDVIRQKRYFLQLKLINKGKVTYINLLNDDLDSIDKVTSICYTKEKFLKILHPSLIEYILDNYEKGDLVITYKQGDFIREIDVLQREYRYLAYIDRKEIDIIIYKSIINSRRINGKKLTQADYFMALVKNEEKYKKLTVSAIFKIHEGQLGKRAAIQALLDLKVIKDRSIYVPTMEDVEEIQKKLVEIYKNSIYYMNAHSQITLEGFTSKDGIIKQRYSSSLTYNMFPYLRKLRETPDAEYYIDSSFYPENLDTNIEVKDGTNSFDEFLEYEDRKENLKNKLKRHANYQKDIKDIYFEKINEYITRYDKIKVMRGK